MATIGPAQHTLRDGRSLTIRSVEPDEAAGLIAYLRAISTESEFLGFGPGEAGMTVEQERACLAHCSTKPGAVALVGCVGGDIVASLNFTTGPKSRTRHVGEFGMSVRRAHWGLGVGTAMVGALLAWARQESSVVKVNLRVRTDNARALAIYERCGFSVEGTLTRDLCVDGCYYDHYAMGLSVD